MASQVLLSPRSSKKRLKTVRGDGSTYSGRQPLHTTACHAPTAMTMASTFGQAPAQRRAAAERLSSAGASRASRPASSASTLGSTGSTRGRRSSTMAMAGDLLAQAGGDLGGEGPNGGRLDAA